MSGKGGRGEALPRARAQRYAPSLVHKGDVIGGRFVVESVLGAGGMGVVLRTFDRSTGTPAAVKLLKRPPQGVDPRFEREAQVLESLLHPAIVGFLARGTTPSGEPFLAMEWLDGETLTERLRGGPLHLTETITLGIRVSAAMQAAHDRGIVHRDLKPSNLFLEHRDVARTRVLDFGIARLLQLEAGLTATGEMIGTPGYMSPEQARGERNVDARTDVFAMGCVLFRCLTGRDVFGTEEGIGIFLVRVLTEPAPRLRSLSSQVPERLDDLVDRMLDKDPARRPANGGEVLAALQSIAADASPMTGLPPPNPAAAARPPTSAPSGPWSAAHSAPTASTVRPVVAVPLPPPTSRAASGGAPSCGASVSTPSGRSPEARGKRYLAKGGIVLTLLAVLAVALILGLDLVETSSSADASQAPSTTNVDGAWRVTEGRSPSGARYGGSVQIGRTGAAHLQRWASSGSPFPEGLGLLDGEDYSAARGAAPAGLIVYRVSAGRLTGQIVTTDRPSEVQTEVLQGPPSLVGDFSIVASSRGRVGVMTLSADGPRILVSRVLDTGVSRGVALRDRDRLVVALGAPEAKVTAFLYRLDPSGRTLTGTWAESATPGVGREVLERSATR